MNGREVNNGRFVANGLMATINRQALKGLLLAGGLIMATPTYSQDSAPSSPQQGENVRRAMTNQERHCFENYQEYYKCIAAKGEDFVPCNTFKKTVNELCPTGWIEKMDQQRKDGTLRPLNE